MRLLVLGGTKFVGRAVVEAALQQGYEVTLFNRGRTNPDLFPQAEHLRGDRDGDLSALEGRRWDAVVDPSGYLPRVVRASAELLSDAVEHYVYVSSISAYSELPHPGFDETTPTHEAHAPNEDIQEHYGELKAACERVIEAVFPGRSTIVRAGLVVGPHDPTDRFTYWPVRLARGGEVLAPAPPEQPWQFIDVRDLAAWMLLVARERTSGPFNVTGPARPTSAGAVLTACSEVAARNAELLWVDEDFLLAHDVAPWMELPLWVPASDPDHALIHQAGVAKALAAGLRLRPVEETVADTLRWASTRDGTGDGTVAMGSTQGVGLDPEKEARLLAAWHAR